MTQIITELDFEEKVLKADKPVLVDFYADWCGPCSVMSPIVDELAEEVDGDAYVYKVNVDGADEITRALRIMSIPAFVVFKEGQPARMAVGGQDINALKSMLS